jgi:nucleoside-diphosphate kinase
MDKTLAIFKPDCIRRKLLGTIIQRIEKDGFNISALKMLHLTKPVAEAFYGIHKGKDFFDDLISFMTEGPCVVAVLQRKNAITEYRTLMGSTDPRKAKVGTIRYEFAENVRHNIVHGSDSIETAKHEIAFFFGENELVM